MKKDWKGGGGTGWYPAAQGLAGLSAGVADWLSVARTRAGPLGTWPLPFQSFFQAATMRYEEWY
ncbi:MAG: hypothetical protein EA370_16050 [Wenzhouxiangella sp.]|nr:MAG: hypothetical protein EA370_16050 [Wenzhouxiangella sp.]